MASEYGVLKCRVLEITKIRGLTPHFHIHTIADGVHFRIAINIKSKNHPYDVLYYIDYDFENELTRKLSKMPLGFYEIGPNIKKDYGLDYIRGNLFDIRNMTPLPDTLPGPDNDLNEKLREMTHKALKNQESILYAFGERWGPISGKDNYFRFSPDDGIHYIHMNQPLPPSNAEQDKAWQDGGLLINYLPENKWTAVFLAFQSR